MTERRAPYHVSSAGELDFAAQLRAAGIAGFVQEYKFHPMRRWRFDFADPERMIAFEIEGGAWVNGRHTRGGGFIGDCEKYNEAALLGWTVYRFPTEWVENGKALQYADLAVRHWDES